MTCFTGHINYDMTLHPHQAVAPKIKENLSSVIFLWIMGLLHSPRGSTVSCLMPVQFSTYQQILEDLSNNVRVLAHLDFYLKITVWNSEVFYRPLNSKLKARCSQFSPKQELCALQQLCALCLPETLTETERQEPLVFRRGFLPLEHAPIYFFFLFPFQAFGGYEAVPCKYGLSLSVFCSTEFGL